MLHLIYDKQKLILKTLIFYNKTLILLYLLHNFVNKIVFPKIYQHLLIIQLFAINLYHHPLNQNLLELSHIQLIMNLFHPLKNCF